MIIGETAAMAGVFERLAYDDLMVWTAVWCPCFSNSRFCTEGALDNLQ